MNGKLTPKELLRRIGEIQLMERCKLTKQTRSKSNGEVSEYYALQNWDKKAKKNTSLYVRKEQKAAFDRAYAAYQEFRKLVEQYEDAVVWTTRTKLGVKRPS